MNDIKNQSYTKYFLLALGLHCVVLAVITYNNSSQETIQISSIAPKNNTIAKEINAAIVQPDVPKKIKVAELQKLVEKQEEQKLQKPEKPQKQEIDLEALKLEKLEKIKAEKLAKELEKTKTEQLVKLKEKREQEKQEKEKIEAAQLEQKRIAKVQKEIREAAQKRIIQAQKEQQIQQEFAAKQVAQQAAQQAAVAQQELALQAQRANEQAQLLRTIDRYALLMRSKIHQNWRRPVGIDNLYKCKVAVKLGLNGEVISASVIDSSGNIEFDRSAELAIRKSSPLPLPSDEKMRAPFNNFTFTFDPQMA